MPDLPELAPTGSAKLSRKALPHLGAGGLRVGVTGVRRIVNRAADTALATRHAEAWYVATVLATAAASWALLTIARALTATTKETP